MKILNNGLSNIVVKDKRGCEIVLEPNRSVEVTEETGKKLSRYSFIKVLQEKPKEVKIEVQQETKEEEKKVEVKPKKRKK